MAEFDYIEKNYNELKEEINALANKRSTGPVTLVAVTKSGTDEELIALAKCGVTDIGENRPGEAKRRFDLLSSLGYHPNMHEIGHLQTNKVKLIADDIFMIHSVDNLKLAQVIQKEAEQKGRIIPVLIEINSACEENKSGVLPDLSEELFLKIRNLENISVRGIMTMGPLCENPEDIRPYFKLTKKIFDDIKKKYGYDGEGVLSMGMSDSYRIAIEEGATLVRVGRKLFKRK